MPLGPDWGLLTIPEGNRLDLEKQVSQACMRIYLVPGVSMSTPRTPQVSAGTTFYSWGDWVAAMRPVPGAHKKAGSHLPRSVLLPLRGLAQLTSLNPSDLMQREMILPIFCRCDC